MSWYDSPVDPYRRGSPFIPVQWQMEMPAAHLPLSLLLQDGATIARASRRWDNSCGSHTHRRE